MFFQVYEASTPEGYLQTHTIKYLNLFGSSGYAIDRRMAGAAPQGMIWIYNINELNTQYTGTVRADYISVLFHESAHTLHEERAYPPEFDKLSALEYQKQDAFSYWWRTGQNASYAGFVSDYASTDADEDFAELFAYYILDSDSEWADRSQGCRRQEPLRRQVHRSRDHREEGGYHEGVSPLRVLRRPRQDTCRGSKAPPTGRINGLHQIP